MVAVQPVPEVEVLLVCVPMLCAKYHGMVWYGIAWYCMVLHGIAMCRVCHCVVMHYNAVCIVMSCAVSTACDMRLWIDALRRTILKQLVECLDFLLLLTQKLIEITDCHPTQPINHIEPPRPQPQPETYWLATTMCR
jgi:hypothetical protein